MKTEIIDAWTSVNKDRHQLLVLPAVHTAGGSNAQYQQEGHKVARWIIGVFCDRTLEFIRDELDDFLLNPKR